MEPVSKNGLHLFFYLIIRSLFRKNRFPILSKNCDHASLLSQSASNNFHGFFRKPTDVSVGDFDFFPIADFVEQLDFRAFVQYE